MREATPASRKVYMDYAAATPVDPAVLEAMSPFMSEAIGNPSSVHSWGEAVKDALERAREKVAELISAQKPEEIIFTSCATESSNLAIKGLALRNRDKGNHIITTKIEHISVLNICKHLQKHGFKVTYLPVDKYGLIDVEQLKDAITDKTLLISIIHANSEIGTIEPIEEIGRIAKECGAYFHVDAVAAAGKIPIDVERSRIDLLTLSSNDIYGPKGVGALYIRMGTPIEPIIHGGGQEQGLRSGTENVPGIVGMGKAAELASERLDADAAYLTSLRDMLIEGVLTGIEESYLNGHPRQRLPNNVNLRFTGIEGESLILALNHKGIAASTGSACTSKTLEPSHVLMAIGLNEVEAHGSLLLTLGRYNTKEEVEYVLETLKEVVAKLRAMSPLWGKPLELEKWKSRLEEGRIGGEVELT